MVVEENGSSPPLRSMLHASHRELPVSRIALKICILNINDV
jgi:hypothetical protein